MKETACLLGLAGIAVSSCDLRRLASSIVIPSAREALLSCLQPGHHDQTILDTLGSFIPEEDGNFVVDAIESEVAKWNGKRGRLHHRVIFAIGQIARRHQFNGNPLVINMIDD